MAAGHGYSAPLKTDKEWLLQQLPKKKKKVLDALHNNYLWALAFVIIPYSIGAAALSFSILH